MVDDLSRRLGPYFKRKSIPCHKSPPLPERELAKHLTVRLRKGELALVHFAHKTYFQPTMSAFTVADLLRVIRQFDPTAPTKRLIPLFITDATSKKQREVVQLLGAYGVSYALFLSPSDPLPEQERLIGDALVDFVELLENDFDRIADPPSDFDEAQMAPTKRYQELLALGADLMERGRIEEAIEAYTQALALKPDFDLLIHRGDAYYQSRKYVAALTDYRKAQSLKNSTPEPDAKIGACCLILAKEMKKEDPAKAAEWFDKGVARLETSRERAKELEAAYADEPERLGGSPYGAILKALRAVDIGANDFDDKQERLSAVIETAVLKTGAMGEDDLDTLLDRGAGMAALGRYDEAEELFRGAFQNHPVETTPACNNFAVALRKGGRFERAFDLFLMMAEAKGPDHDRILKNMRTAAMHYAHALIVGGKGEEAEKIYARALKCKMDDPEWTLCDLAMAHFHAGSPSTAKIYLNKALTRNPSIVSSRRFADYKGLATLLSPDKGS